MSNTAQSNPFLPLLATLATTPPGLVVGEGGPRDDLVPARLPLGSSIICAKATEIIGADTLELLTAAVQIGPLGCWLSPGEFVLPPIVSAVLGRELVDEINSVGNALFDGLIEADHPDVLRVRDLVDDITLRIIADHGREMFQPLAVRPDAPMHGLGGYLGVAMGAGADEWHRQRQADRLDNADKRAQEQLNLQKQTAAQTAALHGIQIKTAERKLTQQEAADQALREIQTGYKQILAGDFSPITEGIDNFYNKQLGPFNDGKTLAYQTDAKGNLVLNEINADGSAGQTHTLSRLEVANHYLRGKSALLKFQSPELFQAALSAEATARERAADRASREKIATGNNATSLSVAEINQGGTDRRHADDLAIKRGDLDIKRERLDIDRQRGGLTLQQQRQNAEIDAAREALSGLTSEEIKRRVVKSTDSGRENKDYDPMLERAVRTASRRKIGPDDVFDSRPGLQPAEPKKTPKQAALEALAANPNMAGFTLGEQTAKGFKVLDASGKHVGFLGRQ